MVKEKGSMTNVEILKQESNSQNNNLKQCQRCGGGDFYANGRCRACRRKDAARYRESSKESTQERLARYRMNNAEHIRDYKSAYHQRHRSEINAKKIIRRALIPDVIREKNAEWKKANPDKCRIHNINYVAKKKANGGKLSHGIAKKLHALQQGKCAICQEDLGPDIQLDHIMPIALGGSNSDENIQLTHKRCNQQKNMKHPVDFMQERGFLL